MDISDLLNDEDDSSFDWEFDGDEAGASDEEVAHLKADSCDESTDDGPLTPEPSARRTGDAVVLTFFTADFRDALRGWTNENFREKVKDLTPGVEFDVFLDCHKYYATDRACRVLIIKAISRAERCSSYNVSKSIPEHSCSIAHLPPKSVSAERRAADPLWRCRVLMAEIQKKIATIAVPVGAVSLDENTVWTKARSTAKSYLPSKSDKYGDNGSGKKLTASPAERYVGILPDLLSPLFRTLSRENSQ
ncbi:LOW QUALITY PROTEIN: Hypothetical protein PHPALM_13895 [Phytophthora palmivora]|uniref:PiggyBac transposable element-derived protein domain-containing protein n=1 Tax=Phytophthora palmivora TaxID=4796 RepID=A0A2P4XW58_9STRA|nr:LOW QUALITY PROTEIN: Hypothetical protein PHPALM_13895 [Phytophthora palmivora]